MRDFKVEMQFTEQLKVKKKKKKTLANMKEALTKYNAFFNVLKKV